MHLLDLTRIQTANSGSVATTPVTILDRNCSVYGALVSVRFSTSESDRVAQMGQVKGVLRWFAKFPPKRGSGGAASRVGMEDIPDPPNRVQRFGFRG